MSQRVAKPQSAAVVPPLARRWRWVLSLVIGLHLLAVFLAPFTFASTPAPGMEPSPAALSLMRWFYPYIEGMFLQHGYAFFAPDPGPSHLFRVKLEYADGRPAEVLTFPDLKRHRPRLLYHRHFMLSERLVVGDVPSAPPPQMAGDANALAQWRSAREAYETYYHALRDSYLHHLRARHGADKATLVRVAHRMGGVDEVIDQHRRIDARNTYEDHPDDVVAEEVPSERPAAETPRPVRIGPTRPRPAPAGAAPAESSP